MWFVWSIANPSRPTEADVTKLNEEPRTGSEGSDGGIVGSEESLVQPDVVTGELTYYSSQLAGPPFILIWRPKRQETLVPILC